MSPEFTPYPKLARLFRDMVVTEKIDGTNACVVVTEEGEVHAQSRKRIITPEQDNFGFARWVADNADALRELGAGHHFGEWWGLGIQRGYGLDEKRFSLFNPFTENVPACCHVVPVLAEHTFDLGVVEAAIQALRADGSAAAPGFPNPEGVIVYHTKGRIAFKATLEDDAVPKSLAVAA